MVIYIYIYIHTYKVVPYYQYSKKSIFYLEFASYQPQQQQQQQQQQQ